jgi:hypothetical protein
VHLRGEAAATPPQRLILLRQRRQRHAGGRGPPCRPRSAYPNRVASRGPRRVGGPRGCAARHRRPTSAGSDSTRCSRARSAPGGHATVRPSGAPTGSRRGRCGDRGSVGRAEVAGAGARGPRRAHCLSVNSCRLHPSAYPTAALRTRPSTTSPRLRGRAAALLPRHAVGGNVTHMFDRRDASRSAQ